ncbi:MAG: hypothetical protein N3B21_02605 [Clostridia bacterium]|nr:hypothetical protein [Clostridia bacterium]
MDKISMSVGLLIGFTEMLLMVIITLAAAGYSEVLNFRDRRIILKLLLTSSLMIVSAFVVGVILPSQVISAVVQLVSFYIIIILVFKYKLMSTLLGYILSLAAITALYEAISLLYGAMMFNLKFGYIYQNDIVGLIRLLPFRAVYILSIVIIIYKIASQIKFTMHEGTAIFSYFVVFFGIAFILEKNVEKLPYVHVSMAMIVWHICLIFSVWMIYNISRLRKKIAVSERKRVAELQRIRNLLAQGEVGYVMELLNNSR